MCLAIPGKVVELVAGQNQVGMVEVAGVRRKVQLGLLADDLPETGDWVLIHVGFAMSKISESQAAEQMHLLSMLGEKELAIEEVRGYGQEERPALPDQTPAPALRRNESPQQATEI